MIIFRFLLLSIISLSIISCVTTNTTKPSFTFNPADKSISFDGKNYFYFEIKDRILNQPDTNAFYPKLSLEKKEQGDVSVRIYVNELGLVENAVLLKSSLSPRLDRAALEVSKRYVFKPCKNNNQLVSCYTNLSINFKTND